MQKSLTILTTLLIASTLGAPYIVGKLCQFSKADRYFNHIDVKGFQIAGSVSPGNKFMIRVTFRGMKEFYLASTTSRVFPGLDKSSKDVFTSSDVKNKNYASTFQGNILLQSFAPKDSKAFRTEIEFKSNTGKALFCMRFNVQY